MGNSRAGDCGRLILLRGHGAASVSYIQHLTLGVFSFGEDRHAR
jgi:hypothetical protein